MYRVYSCGAYRRNPTAVDLSATGQLRDGSSKPDRAALGRLVRNWSSISGAQNMGNLLLRNPQDENAKIHRKRTADVAGGALRSSAAISTPFSDIAALLVFEHQAHTDQPACSRRLGTRAVLQLALPTSAANQSLTRTLLQNNARELVDYLLFVDEAPLPGAVGESTFASEFGSRGAFRQAGAVAKAARSFASAPALSVQLHDLQ